MFNWKVENNEKEAGDGPYLKKDWQMKNERKESWTREKTLASNQPWEVKNAKYFFVVKSKKMLRNFFARNF